MVDSDMEVAVCPIEKSLPHQIEPIQIPLNVTYEDDDFLVVNKPRGLLTHPAPNSDSPSLVHALLARGNALSRAAGAFRPGIVHRLDKDTTGLLAVAKHDTAHKHLAHQISEKTALRVYLAVVSGDPPRDRFDVDAPLGSDPRNRSLRTVRHDGKPALTHFRVLTSSGALRLLACRLSTGRTHQIRVHLAALGLPVVGDRLYGKQQDSVPLQLHAAVLHIDKPSSGERVRNYALPPDDFLMTTLADPALLEEWHL
jgi:23S rRNA pseudouridine1911/1915/1917 synthase